MKIAATNSLGQPVGVAASVELAEPPSSAPMQGHYCSLVPLNSGDHAEHLFAEFAAAADEGDWTYLPYGPFAAEEDLRALLQSFDGQDDPAFFAILDPAGQAVGLAAYLRINRHSATIEVGHIHLSRSLQQTAAATEVMYLMMRRVFESGYRRYEWKCDALNAPSIAAATRLGFVFEGTWRKATHYKGRNRDTAWFAIVDDDWPALRAEFERWLAPANFDDAGHQLSSLQNRNARSDEEGLTPYDGCC